MSTRDSLIDIATTMNQVYGIGKGRKAKCKRIKKMRVPLCEMRIFQLEDSDFIFTTLNDKFISLTKLDEDTAKMLGITRPHESKPKVQNVPELIQLTEGL